MRNVKEEVTAEKPPQRSLLVKMPIDPATEGPANATYGRWRVHCRGTARSTGKPCKNWAIRGHHVCVKHGGQLPSVRAMANRKFVGLAHAAVEEFARAMEPWEKKAARLSAAKAVMRLVGPALTAQAVADLTPVDAFIAQLKEPEPDGGVREPKPSPPAAPSSPATVPLPEPDRELVDA